jgi:RNA polymerase sigma-70 factor (ECF subfamily)
VALRVDDVDLVRDRALVERFQEGDPAAFETLYRRYFARLARFCQKRVGDPHEAEEIAQEAFTRALRALPTFEGERRFYPWMTVIAGRLCVDAHRRRGRSEPSSQVDLGVIEGGQEKIVDAVDVQILATALGRLAPRHREVLDLREQQGWSYQQIADHYDVTLGTVEALLFRARKALRREFMAVVGGERNWAAVPVVGGAFGRIASAKARAEAWAAGLLPSLSGPAMAAAIAVTAVTGAAVGGAMLHEHRDGAGAPTGVLRRNGLPASTSASIPELLDEVSADGPAPAHTADAPRPVSDEAVDAGPPPVSGSVASLDFDSWDGTTQATQEEPVRVEPVPGVLTTSNPEGAVADVLTGTINYINQIGEGQ